MKALLITVGLLAMTADAASAQDATRLPANRADGDCVIAVMAAGAMLAEDHPLQAGLASGLMYFLGRLEGRSPGVDWPREIERRLLTDDVGDVAADQVRCGQQMIDVGRELEEVGARLQAAAR